LRLGRIGEFTEDPENGLDYDAYMEYLENDIGEYIQNADRELSWIHGILSPNSLRETLQWYIDNFNVLKNGNELKAGLVAKEIFATFSIARMQLYSINVIAATRNAQGFDPFMVEILNNLKDTTTEYSDVFYDVFAPGSCS